MYSTLRPYLYTQTWILSYARMVDNYTVEENYISAN